MSLYRTNLPEHRGLIADPGHLELASHPELNPAVIVGDQERPLHTQRVQGVAIWGGLGYSIQMLR